MRKEHSTWIYGDYEDLAPQDDHLFLYKRWDENGTYYVVLNFSEESMVLSELNDWGPIELLISNYKQVHEEQLEPWEARIYRAK